MKKSLIVFISLTVSMTVYGETGREQYVRENDRFFMVSPALFYQNTSFTLFSNNAEKRKMKYQPNVLWNAGVNIGIGPVGAGFSTTLPSLGKDEAVYGKPDNFDLQFNYYRQTFGIDLIVQKYQGFFLDNIGDYDSRSTASPDFKRSDIRQLYFGVNAYYNFNENLSLKAAFKQTERQLKSAAAFLLMGSFNFVSVKSDRSMILPGEEQYFGEFAGFKGTDSMSFSVAPGFAATIVLGNFFFMPAGFFGIGAQFNNIEGAVKKSEQFVPFVLKINFRPAIGYNSDGFFAGFYLLLDYIKTHNQTLQIDSSAMMMSLYIGLKF